jgi:hypothetical protein
MKPENASVFDLRGIAVFLDVHLEREQARDLTRVRVRGRPRRDLVVVDEPLVKARALSRGQKMRHEVEQRAILGRVARHVPYLEDARLRDAVLRGLPRASRALGHPLIETRDGRSRRDIPEVRLHLGQNVLRVDVAGDHERRVIRPVIRLEPLLDVVELGCVQVFHRTDHRPRVRVARRKARLRRQLFRYRIRLVVALALFVLDDAALLVEPRLVDRADQMAHAIGLQEEDLVESRFRDVLEVVRPIVVGRSVQVGRAERLDRLEVVVVVVLAAVEHQVFEKVGETRPSGLLVLRAHVVPDVHRHDGRLVVLVDDQREAVVQRVFLERDIGNRELGCERRERRGQSENGQSSSDHVLVSLMAIRQVQSFYA